MIVKRVCGVYGMPLQIIRIFKLSSFKRYFILELENYVKPFCILSALL